MLIDTNGKIVFKGHPAGRKNLEQDFDDLIAGKTLTGDGTGAEAADEEEGGEGGKSKADPATALAAIDEFAKTVGKTL
jgi:hypothetical protein